MKLVDRLAMESGSIRQSASVEIARWYILRRNGKVGRRGWNCGGDAGFWCCVSAGNLFRERASCDRMRFSFSARDSGLMTCGCFFDRRANNFLFSELFCIDECFDIEYNILMRSCAVTCAI